MFLFISLWSLPTDNKLPYHNHSEMIKYEQMYIIMKKTKQKDNVNALAGA